MKKDQSFLALKDAYSDFWNIPGGRTTPAEINLPVSECLRRELLEELGLNIRFELEKLYDVYKFRVHAGNKLAPDSNLFLVFYTGKYLGGDIILNSESIKYEWLTAESYRQCNFGSYQKIIDRYVQERLQP